MASLFDSLFNTNRPALDAAVMQGQAMAGLHTAQTEDAFQQARYRKDQNDASDRIDQTLGAALGPDGQPLFNTSEAAAVKDLILTQNDRDPVKALQALHDSQMARNTSILSDPTQLGTPAATAAAQGNTNKVPEPVAVPDIYTTAPGAAPANPQESPMGLAKINALNASGLLHTNEATNPGAFHPNSGMNNQATPQDFADVAAYLKDNPAAAANIRALVSSGGIGVIRAMMHPGGETAPPAPAAGATAPAAGTPPAPVPTFAQPNGVTAAPGVSMAEQGAIRHDFAAGTAAKQTTSLNTAFQHSQLLDAIGDQLQNGNFTPTNAIAQRFQQLTGSPVPQNLAVAASFLGREAVRATVNSGAATGQERELQMNDSSSPAQIHGVTQTIRTLLGGQLHSLDLRARRGGVDISQLVDPAAAQAYGLGSSAPTGATAAPTAAAAPAVMPLDQYLKSKGF
jgi:hypothetical protein